MSKEKIEKEIGKNIVTFSYPKGRVDENIAIMVKDAGYLYAITTAYGTNTSQSIEKSPYMLKKVAPRVYESMEDFIVRLYSYNIFV